MKRAVAAGVAGLCALAPSACGAPLGPSMAQRAHEQCGSGRLTEDGRGLVAVAAVRSSGTPVVDGDVTPSQADCLLDSFQIPQDVRDRMAADSYGGGGSVTTHIPRRTDVVVTWSWQADGSSVALFLGEVMPR